MQSKPIRPANPPPPPSPRKFAKPNSPAFVAFLQRQRWLKGKLS